MFCYKINTYILHIIHRYAFNNLSFRILIILSKLIIITGISNETTNELTTYAILCRKVTIFYRQELASLFQVQEKLKTCRISKVNISSSCFIKDDSHVKIVWLHVVVFNEHDYLRKCPFIKILSRESTSKLLITVIQVSKFLFVLDKEKNDLKFS